ncbi:PQQ-like beta-propeller repeat protein [Micromonospora lupini]|uniref:outer membrane protein assembly factor BamB family protein n=1 Tax=Micromonospora lupini TaxID=285679 RepID=UPI0022583793|nr:PQQ-binding-like beta-propeller repeat protein [Micromonospora lupini]MCX5070510.1 PQQ-like beta-propeller repeat protein [Micromonospora lupini]
MTGPVIDLGELRHGPDLDPPPRPSAARGRPLRCALVLVLLLAGLAASGPFHRREVVTLPADPGADALVSGDLFVLVEPLGRTGQRRITATRLPGGEPAWQVPLPAEGRYWGVAQQGETLLVTGHEVGSDGQGTLTMALDRRTGAYRWQQPGNPAALPDGNILMWSALSDDQPGALRGVDPCCGTVRWQVPINPGGEFVFRDGEHGVDRLVVARPSGPTEVRDATTGVVLARADLGASSGGSGRSVQLVDDLLLTIGGPSPTTTAYGLDDLRQRWRVPVDGAMYASDCGVVICVQTRSGGMRALDAATGRELWGSDRWGWVWPYAGRLVATTVSSAGPGAEDLVVLDPPTGRVLAELGRWELARFAPGDPLIGVRRLSSGGLLVAELDVSAGRARSLDVLRDASGDCQALPARLLCRRRDSAYGLWSLPR